MVDQIHFPKGPDPLFSAERVKRVRRRKDPQQESGTRDRPGREKNDPERPAGGGDEEAARDAPDRKRIDVHV